MEGLCHKHISLHVTPKQYNVIGENLIGTIIDLLTNNKDVLDAWTALYGDIAAVFIQREKEIREESENQLNSWSGKRIFILEEKEEVSSTIKRFRFCPVE